MSQIRHFLVKTEHVDAHLFHTKTDMYFFHLFKYEQFIICESDILVEILYFTKRPLTVLFFSCIVPLSPLLGIHVLQVLYYRPTQICVYSVSLCKMFSFSLRIFELHFA